MKWYSQYTSVYNKDYNLISQNVIDKIKKNIALIQNENPIVTVSVIGYNEEKHLVSCLWSISNMQCKYPTEIIGVDNNSSDKTAKIFKDCGIVPFSENRHSCGFARNCGLKHAKGKYHINIDADTMYPPKYVEKMVDALMEDNVVAVSSLWSYIPDKKHSPFGIFIYETIRDIYILLQSIKRPELSVRGLVFAYNTELAKKVGIRTDIIRGEDGSLALGLKKYGKIKFIRSRKVRAVTGYGTVNNDGSFFQSFINRIIYRTKEITKLFSSQKEYIDQESNLIDSQKKRKKQ